MSACNIYGLVLVVVIMSLHEYYVVVASELQYSYMKEQINC